MNGIQVAFWMDKDINKLFFKPLSSVYFNSFFVFANLNFVSAFSIQIVGLLKKDQLVSSRTS